MKSAATSHSRGFANTTVTIQSFSSDGRTAFCLDSHGTPREVNAGVLRSKGDRPQVGERWLINREFGTWTFAAFLPTGSLQLLGRQSTSYVTAALVAGATEVGTINLATGFRLLDVATTAPARVRLYATLAARTMDLDREISTLPDPGCGIVMDFLSAPTLLAAPLSPVAEGASLEAQPSASIPIAVTAVSGGVITVTLTWVATE